MMARLHRPFAPPRARRRGHEFATPLLIALAPWLAAAAEDPPGADDPEVILEEAYYREVAVLDIEGAIEGYRRLLSREGTPPRLAARARLRLGISCELLGRTQESVRELERVIEEHPGELDIVRLARRHLGERRLEDPARFLPADLLAYVELVRPADHIRAFSEIVKGTPFQNPVDSYLQFLEGGGPGESSAAPAESPLFPVLPREVRNVSALLNESFLRDLQMVEGLALGIPSERSSEEDFLLILLPGASDILRGVVQWALSQEKDRTPHVGSVHKLPIFRLEPAPEAAAEQDAAAGRDAAVGQGSDPAGEGVHPDHRVHVAMGDALGGEVILAGRPRALLEAAIVRYATRAPSLADDEDFTRAQATRAGTLVFSYLDRARLVEALERGAEPAERPVIAALSDALGVEKLHALSFALSRTEAADSLRLAFKARIDPGTFDAREALGTPPLDPELLRAVPADTLGFAAARLDRGAGRWEAIERLARRFLAALPEDGRAPLAEGIERLDAALAAGPGRALLEELDGVALSLGAALRASGPASVVATFRFADPDRGAETLERGLTAIFHDLLRSPAARTWTPETLEAGRRPLPARALEPFPGVRLHLLPLGDLVLASFSAPALVEAAEAYASRRDARSLAPADGVSKILFVRPAALLRAIEEAQGGRAPGLSPELRLILSEVAEALAVTREGGEQLSVEILVPGVTPAARAILTKLPLLGAR
jgi:hypothetical protein